MKYALGHAFSLSDLFTDLNLKSLNISADECKELIGYKNRRELAKAIYSYSVKLVLDSLIDDDRAFKLPSGAKDAKIRLKRIDGQDFINSRKNGKFSNVDFMVTNNSGYQPELQYQFKNVITSKPIYVNKENRERIEDKINDGEHYTQ